MSSDTRDAVSDGLAVYPVILAVSRHTIGRRAVIEIDGELDLAGTPMLTAAVRRALDEPREVEHIEVDATKVAFVDSAGLNLLLNLRADAAKANITLEVAAASRPFRRVVELAGLGDALLPR